MATEKTQGLDRDRLARVEAAGGLLDAGTNGRRAAFTRAARPGYVSPEDRLLAVRVGADLREWLLEGKEILRCLKAQGGDWDPDQRLGMPEDAVLDEMRLRGWIVPGSVELDAAGRRVAVVEITAERTVAYRLSERGRRMLGTVALAEG